MSLVDKSENSITYEDSLILFNGRKLIEHYPTSDLEYITISDGSLLRFENNDFFIVEQGDAVTKKAGSGKILIDPDKIDWVVFGEISWA